MLIVTICFFKNLNTPKSYHPFNNQHNLSSVIAWRVVKELDGQIKSSVLHSNRFVCPWEFELESSDQLQSIKLLVI
jgi:hypothetical protein